ncbi:hypothetical protein ACJRO7_010141 [Eucalyptus globulus]|uniref:DUF3700 domain-containing protein n=1 Tax=Eucalyptus globulus TaxID=34317 RepID=A0ABD3LB26_EUCGL
MGVSSTTDGRLPSPSNHPIASCTLLMSEDKVIRVASSYVPSMARNYSLRKYPMLPRRRLFAVDISYLFQGHIENVVLLKQQYGWNKTENEVIIVIEAYRTLRDWRPYPADQVVRDITRKFVFVLFHSSSKTAFQASESNNNVHCVAFFWGSDSGGNLVLSDGAEVVKIGCGKSFAPFPKEHPPNKVKPVPRVDSSGHVCGVTFKVDAETKDSSMPRVGSAANWSSFY